MTELIQPVDPERMVIDYLYSLPLFSAFGIGTKHPPDQTPEKFIRVQQVGGDSPNDLLFRFVLQIRVWDDTPYMAGRMAAAAQAHLRRGLGARVVAPSQPLPDSVDTSKTFVQFQIQLPTIGEVL